MDVKECNEVREYDLYFIYYFVRSFGISSFYLCLSGIPILTFRLWGTGRRVEGAGSFGMGSVVKTAMYFFPMQKNFDMQDSR